jgi:hypothetical protein
MWTALLRARNIPSYGRAVVNYLLYTPNTALTAVVKVSGLPSLPGPPRPAERGGQRDAGRKAARHGRLPSALASLFCRSIFS